MPSANKTSNYGLNQWEGNEYPRRVDFNGDNQIIDVAIKAAFDLAGNAVSKAGDTMTGQLTVTPGMVVGTMKEESTLGLQAFVQGGDCEAPGGYAAARGFLTSATAYCAYAEGTETKATGPRAHAEGRFSVATNDAAHAEGRETLAEGINAHAEGLKTKATGNNTHAEGQETLAQGANSHAEGRETIAERDNSHAEGRLTIATGISSHAEGYLTKAMSECSHAEGRETITEGANSHAEGLMTKATGISSHAEGQRTMAINNYSHAEGFVTLASGQAAHAEGSNTLAFGTAGHAENLSAVAGSCAHAEGGHSIAVYGGGLRYVGTATSTTTIDLGVNVTNFAVGDTVLAQPHSDAQGVFTTITAISGTIVTIADTLTDKSGEVSTGSVSAVKCKADSVFSHAEGYYTLASGLRSHAEGYYTTASNNQAHAEGDQTIASGAAAHAEGNGATASGATAHAEGNGTTASGTAAHAEGNFTKALAYLNHVSGQYNIASTHSATAYDAAGDAIIVGNGTSNDARSNCFRVTFDGKVYGLSAFNSTGADYAEWFEWLDGNPEAEERIGKFVTLDGSKIRVATNEDEYILGVVTTNPSVIGNSDTGQWNSMWLRDAWGRLLFEDVPVERQTETIHHPEEVDENGEIISEAWEEEIEIIPAGVEKRMVLNPDYDPTREYVPREDRPEWDAVGMLGQLYLYHDGTCEVNSYCLPNTEGIATKSGKDGYRIIEVKDDLVKIIFR